MKNDISVNDLFETNICQILSEKIQRKYDAKSNEGKMCRRLLLHFQSWCRKDPGFRESEDLPNITDDSDTGSPLAPIRSFRGLFSTSVIAGNDQMYNSIFDELPILLVKGNASMFLNLVPNFPTQEIDGLSD